MMRNCCFCGRAGTTRQIRAHIPKAHRVIYEMVRRASYGRPNKYACDMCGMVHDDVARPGWADQRKKLERPRIAVISARLPAGHGGQMMKLGRTRVPEGATRIKGFWVWADKPGRFRIRVRSPDSGLTREMVLEFPQGVPVHREYVSGEEDDR